jgi:hypothetical protein
MSRYKTSAKTSTYERRLNDLYETPAWVTQALCESVALPKVIWEPAAGRGAIVNILRARGHDVIAHDIEDYGRGYDTRDFLSGGKRIKWFKGRSEEGRAAIVTNPPFSLAKEFIETSLKSGADLVALLLPADYASAKTRAHLFRDARYSGRVTLLKRPVWIEGTKNGGMRNFSWFIWDNTLTRHQPGKPFEVFAP